MDSFKQIWGVEGCSSSESGWTMYIDSPLQEEDTRCSNENDGYREIYGKNWRRKKDGSKVDEEESDDSMASDASSGPIHYNQQQHGYDRGQSSHEISNSNSKKDRKDHGSKCSSKKNCNKQEKKRVDSRSKK